jgi:hypothetical protein
MNWSSSRSGYETAERLEILFRLALAVASIEVAVEEAKRPAG